MKRHQRISRQARQHLGWCLVFLSASVALGVWSMGVNSSSVPGGTMLLPLALIGLLASFLQGRAAYRLHRLAQTEIFWDRARLIQRI